jgi:DinB superfamily
MRIPILIAALTAAALPPAPAAQISTQERSHLVAHLEMTGGWLIDEVSSLSPAQLVFRPAQDSWSVMEVLEHLVVVGPIYWSDLQKAVRGPATTRPSMNTDLDMLWYGIDRTNREIAIPTERPPGRLRDLKAAIETYRTHHARLVGYAKTTTDDLRRRFVDRQGCDAYQWALLISTHEQRHILQIREIKQHPRFPSR